MQAENEKQIEQIARKRVVEFVNNCDPNDDFFPKIEAIYSQTWAEFSEQFKNTCSQWDGILNNAEQHFLVLLKERLLMKKVKIGILQSKDGEKKAIEWAVLSVDPTLENIHLLSTTPMPACSFHEKGYTDIEDEDAFGCAEVACSWGHSDIRAYLSGEFFNNTFSDTEKEYIVPQKRHYNVGDFLIPNDVSEDKVYLLKLDEFLVLDLDTQRCSSAKDDEMWWLGEQKSRGWDDTCELPKIYTVNCQIGKLMEATPDKVLFPRVSMTVKLDYLLSTLPNTVLW